MSAKRKLNAGDHVKNKFPKANLEDKELREETIQDYRGMLYKVGECLDKTALHHIARLEGLPVREIEMILDPGQDSREIFFHLLEKRGTLQVNDVSQLRRHLETIKQMDAVKIITKYEDSISRKSIPSEPESEDEDDEDENKKSLTFGKLLEALGLQGKYPGKLRLDEFLLVRDDVSSVSLVYSFWQKISSLDYRAGLTQNLSSHLRMHCNMRDFIFTVLHCAEDFLRQDILEKMSACQLAVPILLSGINKSRPIFLRWASRRIIKKWKGREDSFAIEQPIICHPIFTVAFLRIGEVGVSKSEVLNHMLGPSQGFSAHTYFLTKETTAAKVSLGSLESVWFLPNPVSGKEIFTTAMAFLNLRGDSNDYHTQMKFACNVANLTVVFVATDKRLDFEGVLQSIHKRSSHTLFVSVREKQSSSRKLPRKGNWIFVKNFDLQVLAKELGSEIANISDQTKGSLSVLVNCDTSFVNVDDDKEIIKKAKTAVEGIFDKNRDDVLKFKKDNFHLQEEWEKVAKLQKERFAYDNDEFRSLEHENAQRESDESVNRRKQLQYGLTSPVKEYWRAIQNVAEESVFVKYFLEMLHDFNFMLVNRTANEDLKKLSVLEKSIKQYNDVHPHGIGDDLEHISRRQRERQIRERGNYNKLLTECNKLHERSRHKSLGCEHFLRELGQQYEAYMHPTCTSKINESTDIPLYPSVAAELILQMQSFEVMDGDTEFVPVTWITAVLDAVRAKLGDLNVLVISVIGVQSSGKSTLLNNMFGLRFPVRSGRCTRGVFIRILTLEEKCAQELGFSHLIVIDTQGLRSIDHNNRDVDNELATFALSIANVTIFNIGGENIGPDTAGILQIVSHAMMRMKEVDLECKCMLVQHGVSDVTAVDRNKANTHKIIEMLDKATKFAAEDEGLGCRYQKFSDVVELRIQEELLYVPSLWTGGMTPPNHMYGEQVTKIRESIFRAVRNGTIVPDLTLSTFTERIRDVWMAVREENFVFSFKDSVRAVDYNQFCLRYNEWILQMRKAVMDTTRKCIADIDNMYEKNEVVGIEQVENCLENKVKEEIRRLTSHVEKYISAHPRKSNISKHQREFIEDIEVSLKDAKHQAMFQITEERDIRTLEINLGKFSGQQLVKMIADVKQLAAKFRQCDEKQTTDSFVNLWKTWTKNIKEEHGLKETKITPSDIKTLCDKMLIQMTRGMAVGSDIRYLFSKEGGIEKHIKLSDLSKYVTGKHVQAWNKQRLTSSKQHSFEAANQTKENDATEYVAEFLRISVESSLRELKGKARKRFDRNLFQVLVGNALLALSNPSEGMKLPNILIAKGLLHLCGRAFNEVFQHTELRSNDFSHFFESEDQIARLHFSKFVTQSHMENCASEFINYYMQKDLMVKLQSFTNDDGCRQVIQQQKLPWDLLCFAVRNDYCFFLQFDNLSVKELSDMYFRYYEISHKERLHKEYNDEINRLRSSYIETLTRIEANIDENCPFQEWINRLLSTTSVDKTIAHAVDLYDSPQPIVVSRQLRELLQKWNPQHDEDYLQLDFTTWRMSTGLLKVCEETCPMCGMFCDNVMENHKTHSSHLHRPRGLTGETYPGTNNLVLEDCSSSVLLPEATCTIVDKEFLCKNYKEHYPNWLIQPCRDNPGKRFWHWLFVNLAEQGWFDEYGTNFPKMWLDISSDEAIKHLLEDKKLTTEGRSTNIPSSTAQQTKNGSANR